MVGGPVSSAPRGADLCGECSVGGVRNDSSYRVGGEQPLSRKDRKAVRGFLEEMLPGADQLAALRHALLAVAESRLADHDARAVLHWSHELGKLLLPAVPAGLPEVECYFSPSESGRRRLCGLIGTARERIDLCMYLLADDELARALIKARRDHGVVVRLILDDDQTKQAGSDHEALAEAGVLIRTDSCAQYMHHKFGIYDGAWLSTGSANWTARGGRSELREHDRHQRRAPGPALHAGVREVVAGFRLINTLMRPRPCIAYGSPIRNCEVPCTS